MATTRDVPPPIAIIGMGLRLPGGVSTPEDFWSLLVNKEDGQCRVPTDRYNIEAFHGDEAKKQPVASDQGYFLKDVNIKQFDASFFSMNKSEVEFLDPQHRLLLEVVWECMENAGQTNWRGTDIGCFVGTYGEDWHDMSIIDTQASGLYRISGNGDFAMSNRISYEYNLTGPSMTIRTACSSTLTGVHEACRALYNGDCSAAIIAGSNLIITPTMTLAMTEQGVLSPTGSCKTFDIGADGYARGEAVNAILIKRLDDAIRDGDPIRAVIRSTAANSDGKTQGFSNPSSEAHEAMIRQAYETAGLGDFSQTPFVECHGTGTPIGDPLEATAVANVFGGDHSTYIGSVKPNVGHSEGASGITSLIKVVLALENNIIPPNINFSKWNPKIPFERANLIVPVQPTPWPKDRAARASVNSFGIGGANAHVVVDSAASFGIPSKAKPKGLNGHINDASHLVEAQNGHTNGHTNGDNNGKANGDVTDHSDETKITLPRLIPISANNADSLRRRLQELQSYIESRPESIDSVAHTLGTRREHLQHRTFAVAKGDDEPLEFENFQKANVNTPAVAFVFTGQGAQWAAMGKDLVEKSPSFLSDIREMDKKLQSLDESPSWTLEAVLRCEEGEIAKAEFSQPLCTAVQAGLVNMLAKCGIKASSVVGHSSGEIGAAYAAGALTMAEAIVTAFYRGQTAKAQTSPKGVMAAVGLGLEAVSPFLVEGAVVACENSSKSVTLSGDKLAVAQTLEAIKAHDPAIFARKLHVDMAYHSHHMKEIGEVYEGLLKKHLAPKSAIIPFYSSVTGHLASYKSSFGPAYWRSNLESPVLFNTAVRALLKDLNQETLFLEVGPHSALQGPLRQIFQDSGKKAPTYVPTLLRNNDSFVSLLSSVGRLYTHGLPIDFAVVNPAAPILIDLPTYPWDRNVEFWNESRVSEAWRLKKHPHHEILGSRLLESSDMEPSWRNRLRCANVPWLKDHKVKNDIIFPCAGYIATVGEAIRQMTGSVDFTLRNVVIKNAMMLQETEVLETITTAKPTRLTDSADSTWYDFSIMSYNGSAWIKHFVAQGRAGQEHPPPKPTIVKHPRRLAADFWYERLRRLGLNYGPRFQGLKEISADTEDTKATAAIQNNPEPGTRYAVHPTALDYCLQLFTVAMTRGIARGLETLSLPASIGSIYVSPGSSPNLTAEATARTSPKGAIMGDVIAMTETNEVAVYLENGLFNPLEGGDEPDNMDSVAAARLEWRPDIEFLNPGTLMRRTTDKREARVLLEQVTAICILQTLDRLQSLALPSGYLSKHVSWLQREKQRMLEGEWKELVPEAEKWVSMDAKRLDPLMDLVFLQLDGLGDIDATGLAQMSRRVSTSQSVQDIFLEKLNPLQLLIEDNGLTSMYNFFRGLVNTDEFFSLCAHAQPNLRVLEIGGGTGGTTYDVLKALISKEGNRMYSQYMFTDISSGFFSAAQERFKDYSGMSYQALDITKDPAKQGFELGTYDLIVASNVLHATPSLRQTLQHVRSLLRPGGKLFLHEITQPLPIRAIHFITGLLPGWWLGENDNRADEPIVSAERWNEELRQVGFSGTDSVLMDDDAPYHLNAYIVATAVEQTQPVVVSRVTFLYDKTKHEFASQVADRFAAKGIEVHWSQIGDNEHLAGQDVISTIELEDPYFHNISAENYQTFMTYLSNFQTGMLWLTRSAQVNSEDPRFALTLGLARTIRSELSLDFSTVELRKLDARAADAILEIFHKFDRRHSSADPEFNVEPEFAIEDGVVLTSRYHWIDSKKELDGDMEEDYPSRLVIGRYGFINSLQWIQFQPPALQPDDVEVDIRCIGLNFRDVLMTMGIVDGAKDSIGLEASGVITRVGSNVTHLRPGDRVMTMYRGLFSTRRVIPSQLAVRIPDSLSFEDAATIPIIYSTVIHCLITLGQLRKGQTILIQSACGGVGLAALQVCKMLGAEVYCTVGSEEKIKHLMDNYDIPKDRIFNSRNVSFLQDVVKATDGRGVDLVLNSLSGELLHASWQCVARYGKMLEIGKRDFIGNGQLNLNPFEANRAFYGVDLATMLNDCPEEIRKLMDQCVLYYELGYIKPIQPLHAFPAERVGEVFRTMQKGTHIGKFVVAMPSNKNASHLGAISPRRKALLSDKRTYLMIGGFGGLGKALATWMVECGARHFVFLSRSAGKSSEDQDFVGELESQGCNVVAVAGSVVELSDVQRAVKSAPSPVGGVIQMSMVLRDLPITQISHQDWNTVLDPKVRGTWNLHEALSGSELDFFILFSSISGLMGQPGQASYASANAFLDSFVQYRHGLGLPASVIDVGLMDGIGYVSRNMANMLNQAPSMSIHPLQEQDLLDAIQISIQRSRPQSAEAKSGSEFRSLGQLTIGLRSSKPLSDPSNRVTWKRDIRMGLYRHLETVEETRVDSNDGRLRSLLNSSASEPDMLNDPANVELITMEIGRTICGFMLLPEEDLDITQSLTSMGIDSLVAIEIRNWYRRTFGVDISVLEIMNAGTVERLGKHAVGSLKEKCGPKENAQARMDDYLAMKAP
ncbi:Highly reducing polyketide synthase gloL [Cladobotryum mycophilum]|uniref:Highly reducing polyketide synthase gloL n=1 Tax=Cladobotryum mycophilum TaxID=491253 RepID=A0ABR0SWH1_9HYPO